MRKSTSLSWLAMSITATLAGAQAQAAEATSGIEEIIVTARQRSEAISDVPATVQAFTAADIVSAGISRPQDFIALTPGVSQVQTAEVGDMQVNIRGINTGRDAETNIALVIDGVLQTNPNAFNQELANVTQIEVLKGPQGAVYGRNALAGAIILTTKKPGDTFEADIKAGVGNHGQYNGSLYFSAPLSETVGGSLSVYTRNDDGSFKNSYLGCDDCSNYFEENGANGRLTVKIGEDSSLDFKAKYSKIKAGAINFNAAVALIDVADLTGFQPFNEDPNDHKFVYLNNIKPTNEQTNKNVSLKGDFDVGVGTLTAIVAHNDQENFFLTDGTSAAFGLYAATEGCQQSFVDRFGDTPLPPPFNYGNPAPDLPSAFLPPYGPTTCDGYQYQQRDQKDTSVEVRLTSPGEQRLRWQGGLYYADIKRHVIVSQGSDQGLGFDHKGFVPTSGPNPTDLLYDDDFKSKVSAVFGQLAYDVVDNVEVALALRYDREKREVDNNVPTGANAFAQTPGFAFGSNPYINPAYTQDPTLATTGIPNRERTFSQLQPKLTVNWKATDQFSAFASYGYGFRSGGFNSQGSAETVEQAYGGLCLGAGTDPVGLGPPVCTPDSIRNITGVKNDFKKELSKAAELGFKSNFFDRRLSLNGAVFYTKVDDMQFFNFFAGPFGLLRVVTNIDEVEIKGVELDFRWKATDMFSFFGGIGTTDGEIKKYSGRPYTEGNEVPYAPEYTGNLGGEFTLPLGSSGLNLITRIDATFVGETWFHPVQDNKVPNLFTFFNFGQGDFSKMKRDPYETLDARITLASEKWGVTAWGRNLTDKDYLAEVIPAPEFGGSFIHDSAGRAYGLDVNFKF